MVDPDCGLRHVDREVAFGKLQNLRVARDRVSEKCINMSDNLTHVRP